MKFATFDEVAKFHGHKCPGLAMGYKLTISALTKLNKFRAEDEEIVAIVENDACGTDAVQYLSGCTFGKGNFIFNDYGKMIYTFLCRESGKGGLQTDSQVVSCCSGCRDSPCQKPFQRYDWSRVHQG